MEDARGRVPVKRCGCCRNNNAGGASRGTRGSVKNGRPRPPVCGRVRARRVRLEQLSARLFRARAEAKCVTR